MGVSIYQFARSRLTLTQGHSLLGLAENFSTLLVVYQITILIFFNCQYFDSLIYFHCIYTFTSVFNFFQEIEDADAKEQNQLMIPDVQRELISAHTDSEDGWSDGETRRTRQLPGMLLLDRLFCLLFCGF